jgi:hypothetical protein
LEKAEKAILELNITANPNLSSLSESSTQELRDELEQLVQQIQMLHKQLEDISP